jgi:hypothetical protein
MYIPNTGNIVEFPLLAPPLKLCGTHQKASREELQIISFLKFKFIGNVFFKKSDFIFTSF